MERKRRRSKGRASLRIQVAGDETISSQARTYAEYRVFAALTQSECTRNARSAHVVLRQVELDDECDGVACNVTVLLESDTVRVRASGAHPYAAINRAVERLRAASEPSSAERIPS
jgi:ribosome-associated translation inhibitor RaiA